MKHWSFGNRISMVGIVLYTAIASGDSYNDCSVRTFIPARSQSVNSARDYAGQSQLLTQGIPDNGHTIISVVAEYTNSFRPTAVSSMLFGCDLVESRNPLQSGLSLNITGSAVEDIQLDETTWSRNNEKDWLADYFLLPVDFAGQLHLTPRIQNVITGITLKSMYEGWYITIALPVTWTKYDLSADETIYQRGSSSGYTSAITQNMTLKNLFDFTCNHQGLSFEDNGQTITQRPLTCSRICPCASTKSGIADIPLSCGYLYQKPSFSAGAYARVIAPTGNRPEGNILFEPIIGNNHHWELGGGLSGSLQLWHDDYDDKQFSLMIDGCITHLFAAQQVRSFDLKNKPWSRFILAKQFDAQDQPTGIRGPVANVTSCTIRSSFAYQADLLACLSYTSESFTYDLGYNFWARSCEKICRTNDCVKNTCCGSCLYTHERWGLGVTTPDKTESASTIHETIAMLGVPADTTPHYITTADIAYETTQTKSATHKLFMHLGYTWIERNNPPFVGIGGEVEFGAHDSCNKGIICTPGCSSCCSSCYAVGISQWGLWLKGGIAF